MADACCYCHCFSFVPFLFRLKFYNEKSKWKMSTLKAMPNFIPSKMPANIMFFIEFINKENYLTNTQCNRLKYIDNWLTNFFFCSIPYMLHDLTWAHFFRERERKSQLDHEIRRRSAVNWWKIKQPRPIWIASEIIWLCSSHIARFHKIPI